MAAKAKTRDELQQELDELNGQIAGLKRKAEEDTTEVENLQSELLQFRKTVSERDSQIKELKASVDDADRTLKDTTKHHESAVTDHEKELKEHRVANESLHDEIQNLRERAGDYDTNLQRLYHDLENAQAALRAQAEEKDELEAQKFNVDLSLQEMQKEWEEDRAKLDELESLREAMDALQAQQSSYMADQERLTDMLQGHERTLVIKDERIANLEAQIQKALVRNMKDAEAADDANVAAATSLTDDAPPSISAHGGTLDTELGAAYNDYEEDQYEPEPEPLHQSAITAVSTEPKEPSAPRSLCDLSEITDTYNLAPRAAVPHKFTQHLSETYSSAPTTVPPQPLTQHLSETFSFAPEDVAAPKLTQHIYEVGSVEPINAAPQKLGLSISEVGSTTPVERKTASVTSVSIQTDAQNLRIAMLHEASYGITPVAPATSATSTLSTQTDAPLLTSSVVDTASIAVPPSAPASKNAIAPVMATHEEAPIAINTTKTSTSSTGVQTTETLTETAPAPVNEVLKSNKAGFLNWLIPVLFALVLGAWLVHYSELNAWRTANRSHGRSSHTCGTYGTGRYLFNIIPVAMGEHGWVSQSMSKAVTALEGWAGTPTPHY